MTPPPEPPPKLLRRFDYHAALSYSSKDESKVRPVSDALQRKGIKVYDYQTDESLAKVVGYDLKKTLTHIYEKEAMFVVAFISADYSKSEFTRIEREAAERAAKHKRGYLIRVLFEETPEPDIWLNGTLPPERLAGLIENTIRRPPPKPWWFYVSMEMKVAAAAVLLAMIIFARPIINHFLPSRTSVASFDASTEAITAHLKNAGPKSATITGQRLTFGALPIENAELSLDTSESATIAPGERDVKLTVKMLDTKCDTAHYRPNNDRIVALLGDRKVTRVVDVQESNGAIGHPSATIPATRLTPFIRKWVPSHVPPC